jgi:hypothetical protein
MPQPRQIPFETIINSETGGPKISKRALIKNEDELKEFFNGRPPAVDINFTNAFIFAIALGERPTGEYSVRVHSITQYTDDVMAGITFIEYEEIVPSEPVAQMLTSPFTIVQATDIRFATGIFFRKLGERFIVIRPTDSTIDCEIIPEEAYYPVVYLRVFGPATRDECQQWVNTNCR